MGKTTTALNFGVGLANEGKKVLLIDCDPQGDLTTALGWRDTDELSITLADKLVEYIEERNKNPANGILHHKENIDLLPANLDLSALELSLINTMSRETVLKGYVNSIKDAYDYVVIDCISHPLLTKEFLYSWFDGFENFDVNKLKNRKMLIDTFVNSVVLYDDRIDFYFNFKDNAKRLTLSELNTVSDSSSSSPPLLAF